MLLSPLMRLWSPMPHVGGRGQEAEFLADPDVQLALTGRSGPLIIEIEYRVAKEDARAFHNAMLAVQLSRQRNGAYGWSIARDIADPESWAELLLPDLVRLPASAQPRDGIGARAGTEGGSISHRPRPSAGSSHARAPVWISTIQGSITPAAPRTTSYPTEIPRAGVDNACFVGEVNQAPQFQSPSAATPTVSPQLGASHICVGEPLYSKVPPSRLQGRTDDPIVLRQVVGLKSVPPARLAGKPSPAVKEDNSTTRAGELRFSLDCMHSS